MHASNHRGFYVAMHVRSIPLTRFARTNYCRCLQMQKKHSPRRASISSYPPRYLLLTTMRTRRMTMMEKENARYHPLCSVVVSDCCIQRELCMKKEAALRHSSNRHGQSLSLVSMDSRSELPTYAPHLYIHNAYYTCTTTQKHRNVITIICTRLPLAKRKMSGEIHSVC